MNFESLSQLVVVTPVSRGTLEGLRKLRNEPTIRRQFIDSSEVSRGQQLRWYTTQENDPSEITWVATDHSNQVVGAVALTNIDFNLKQAEFGRLMASATVPRPRGLGHYLTRYTIDKARDMRLSKLRLVVFERNDRALDLYREFGFKRTGDSGDLVTMTLLLSN